MKTSTKAACLSLFVFPGVGLLWLKRYTRGLLFLIPAILSFAYIITVIYTTVFSVRQKYMHIIESDPYLVDLSQLVALGLKMYTEVLTELSKQMETLHAAEYFFIACWLCSAFSSYFVGLQIERQKDQETQRAT